MDLSYSVKLIWPIAMQEALSSRYELVEPEHLFAAMLKFAELKKNELDALYNDKSIIDIVLAEQEELSRGLEDGGLGIPAGTSSLRHTLRRKLGIRNADTNRRFVDFSMTSKQFFKEAEDISKGSGLNSLQAVHLLDAMLKRPVGVLAEALDRVGFKKKPASDTPLLNLHGQDLLAEELPDIEKLTDPVSAVLLDSLQSRPDQNILLIENGGRPTLQIMQEVASLLKKEANPRRVVYVALNYIESASESEFAVIIKQLIDEAIAGNVYLYIELDSQLFKSEGGNEIIKALDQGQLRCIIALDSALYESMLVNAESWIKLLSPVWIHPLQKLPW